MNDVFFDENWERSASVIDMFHRPDDWPEQKALVDIISYTLLDNHFHLILHECREGGVSAFMRKIGQSMTNHYNRKHDQKGSLFQGSFHSTTLHSDGHFQYALAYVLVKNTFEMYPRGGLAGASKDFDAAWQWAGTYPFSSLGEFTGNHATPILAQEQVRQLFPSLKEFKSFAHDVILGRVDCNLNLR
jgi:REP element-mobilizing transposase RayT